LVEELVMASVSMSVSGRQRRFGAVDAGAMSAVEKAGFKGAIVVSM
jgi:hypothetical protein